MLADGGGDRRPGPETEETNYIEAEPAKDVDPRPRAQTPNTRPSDNPERHEFVSTEQMSMEQSPGESARKRVQGCDGSPWFQVSRWSVTRS